MRFTIPSSRVYLFDTESVLVGGSTSMPSRPRIAKEEKALIVVGGSSSLDISNSKSRLYVVVNAAGVPVLTGDPPRQKTYEADCPSQAAVKAFYAWWRRTGQGPLAGSGSGNVIPQDVMDCIQSKDVSKEEREAYMALWPTVSETQLSKKLLVRLALAGGSSSSVKNYVVYYERNKKPNKLEIQRGIVVNARAEPLHASSPRPAQVVDLESF